MKTCLQHILDLHQVCRFMSTDGRTLGPASNSEIKRWFDGERKVEINFVRVASGDPLPPVIKSIVISPKNKERRCTLYYDHDVTLIQVKE